MTLSSSTLQIDIAGGIKDEDDACVTATLRVKTVEPSTHRTGLRESSAEATSGK